MEKRLEQLAARNEFLEKELVRMKQQCTCPVGSSVTIASTAAAVRSVRGRLL
jgi:cell division protein FtsB